MRTFFLISIYFISSAVLVAQENDDLMNLLHENQPKKKDYTTATFKTTRLTNFHTLETVGRRTLDFRIMHRFGDVNSGAYNAWGIDGPASIKITLEYSHDGRLMFGLGRSSFQKMIDGFIKYRLLRQTTDNSMPLSVTVFSGAYHNGTKSAGMPQPLYDEINRLSYCTQMIIGRKFNEWFSAQIMPTFIHFNLVEKKSDKNDLFALAGGLRIRYTKRQAITLEYAWRASTYTENQNKKYFDSFGVAWEIETGGHVFALHLTNSFGISETQFIPYSTSSWKDMGIRLGFNISRVFSFDRIR